MRYCRREDALLQTAGVQEWQQLFFFLSSCSLKAGEIIQKCCHLCGMLFTLKITGLHHQQSAGASLKLGNKIINMFDIRHYKVQYNISPLKLYKWNFKHSSRMIFAAHSRRIHHHEIKKNTAFLEHFYLMASQKHQEKCTHSMYGKSKSKAISFQE